MLFVISGFLQLKRYWLAGPCIALHAAMVLIQVLAAWVASAQRQTKWYSLTHLSLISKLGEADKRTLIHERGSTDA